MPAAETPSKRMSEVMTGYISASGGCPSEPTVIGIKQVTRNIIQRWTRKLREASESSLGEKGAVAQTLWRTIPNVRDSQRNGKASGTWGIWQVRATNR